MCIRDRYNPRKFGLDTPFDVVTATPPYEEVVYADLVKALAVSDVSILGWGAPIFDAALFNRFGISDKKKRRKTKETYRCEKKMKA